jgi:hypothetical protein
VVSLARDNRFPVILLAFALASTPVWPTRKNTATGGSGPLQKVATDMLVTLEVFSGRPNPSWTLSTDEERELVRRLQGLPASVGSPTEGDLGYRGFRIVTLSKTAQLPSEVLVTKGVVAVRNERGTRNYIDASGIESWLLEQARRRGYGALVDGHL